MSILVLYKRVITGVARRSFIAVVNGMIVFLVLYAVAYLLLMVFQCRPTESYWRQFSFPDPYTEEFSCMHEGIVPISNAIISVVTDFITAILPTFLFWQLHMPSREKLALSILFGIGFMLDSLPGMPSHRLLIGTVFCPLQCLYNRHSAIRVCPRHILSDVRCDMSVALSTLPRLASVLAADLFGPKQGSVISYGPGCSSKTA
jgi:hypothetical protein